MSKKNHIKLLTEAEQAEFSILIKRHLYGEGQRLNEKELVTFDQLLTKQAEEDYQNYWTDRNIDKEEAIEYLKAKFIRDCFVP